MASQSFYFYDYNKETGLVTTRLSEVLDHRLNLVGSDTAKLVWRGQSFLDNGGAGCSFVNSTDDQEVVDLKVVLGGHGG